MPTGIYSTRNQNTTLKNNMNFPSENANNTLNLTALPSPLKLSRSVQSYNGINSAPSSKEFVPSLQCSTASKPQLTSAANTKPLYIAFDNLKQSMDTLLSFNG